MWGKVWCRLGKEGVIVLEVRERGEGWGGSVGVFMWVCGCVRSGWNSGNIGLVNGWSEGISGWEVSGGKR